MHYHVVGIAGAGMSAIANILLDQGHAVSGSDWTANRLTQALVERGATIHVGHDPAYVDGADAVVVTAAAKPDHPEIVAAQSAHIPIRQRADLWRDWSQGRDVIAVAGTHGKTTTTAMIALILSQAGIDPGFLIGSEAPNLGTNARWGSPTAPLVIEADEYAHVFLALTPALAVITNVEWDHPDIYPTADAYYAAFNQFAAQTRNTLLVCGDAGSGDTHLTEGHPARVLRYGVEPANTYRAAPAPDGAWAVTGGRWSEATTPLCLGVPGLHNVRNALAALAVADQLGVPPEEVAAALEQFRGTARRFEIKGEAAGITVVDDYAHHPTEVRATLAAARTHFGDRRIVAYVQPHTYSRTRTLMAQWPDAFVDADVVLVGAIYAAREVSSDGDHLVQQLIDGITTVNSGRTTPQEVVSVGSVSEATAAAIALTQPGDVLLTLGAGDGDRVGVGVLEHYISRL